MASEYKPFRISGGTGAGDIMRAKALFNRYDQLYRGMNVANWRKIISAPDGTIYHLEGGEIINRIKITEPSLLKRIVVEEEQRITQELYQAIVFFHDGTHVYMKPLAISTGNPYISSAGSTVLTADLGFPMTAGVSYNLFYQRAFKMNGKKYYFVTMPFLLNTDEFKDGGVWGSTYSYIYNPLNGKWAVLGYGFSNFFNYSDTFIYVAAPGSEAKAYSYNGTSLTLEATGTLPATITLGGHDYTFSSDMGFTSTGEVILFASRDIFPAEIGWWKEGYTISWNFADVTPAFTVLYQSVIPSIGSGTIIDQRPFIEDNGITGFDPLVVPTTFYTAIGSTIRIGNLTVWDWVTQFDSTTPGPPNGSMQYYSKRSWRAIGLYPFEEQTSGLDLWTYTGNQFDPFLTPAYWNICPRLAKTVYKTPHQSYNGTELYNTEYTPYPTTISHEDSALNYRRSWGSMHETEVFGRDYVGTFDLILSWEQILETFGATDDQGTFGTATFLYDPWRDLMFYWSRFVDFGPTTAYPTWRPGAFFSYVILPDSCYHGIGYIGTTRIESTMSGIIGQDANKVLGVLMDVPLITS